MDRRALPILAIAVLAGCATSPVHEQNFVRIETPHFEVMSSLDPEATRWLVSDLEAFQQTIEFIAGEELQEPNAKTRVFAFDGRGIRREFGQRGEPGYFLPSMDGGTIVLRTAGGWRDDATEELRHEYAHYLLRNHYGLDLPLWYDEGLAVYASTIDLRDTGAEIGRHRRDHLIRLKSSPWISLSRLLESEHTTGWEKRDRELFSSQAWALVHSMNSKERSKLRKQLAGYIDAVESGTPAKEALSEHFDSTFFTFQKEQQRYIRQDRLHSLAVNLNNRWEPNSSQIEQMQQADVENELGWLLLGLERPERAFLHFQGATELAGSRPETDAGIGQAHAQQGDWQAAKSYFERALATGSESPRVQLALADFYLRQARASEDPAARVDLAERGIVHAEKAGGLDPKSASALALRANLETQAGRPPHPDDSAALAAGRQLPSSVEAELLVARHHFELGQPIQARMHARNAHSRSHSKATQQKAEKLLREIEVGVADH